MCAFHLSRFRIKYRIIKCDCECEWLADWHWFVWRLTSCDVLTCCYWFRLPNADCWCSNNWLTFIAFQQIYSMVAHFVVKLRIIHSILSLQVCDLYYSTIEEWPIQPTQIRCKIYTYLNGLANILQWRRVGRSSANRRKKEEEKTKHKNQSFKWNGKDDYSVWVSSVFVCVCSDNGQWLFYTLPYIRCRSGSVYSTVPGARRP